MEDVPMLRAAVRPMSIATNGAQVVAPAPAPGAGAMVPGHGLTRSGNGISSDIRRQGIFDRAGQRFVEELTSTGDTSGP